MKIQYKLISANITSIGKTVYVNIAMNVNITWPKKIDYRGPVFRFMYRGKTLSEINVESFNRYVVNERIHLKLNISGEGGEDILLYIKAFSEKLDLEYIQPIMNVSSIMSFFKIYIKDISIKPMGNVSMISITTYSNNPINAPVKIVLLDNRSNILVSRIIEDYNSSTSKYYTVKLMVENTVAKNLASIEFYIEGYLVSKYSVNPRR